MRYNLSFPHFDHYGIVLRHFVLHGLEMNYIMPPPMTKRTLELGSKYSPDYVCAPFKLNLGCFIEAIEAGADGLLQVGGACRLGYYGELQQQILSDLGYSATFFNLGKADFAHPLSFLSELRAINPDLSLRKVMRALLRSLRMLKYMDEIDEIVRRNVGFEVEPGSFEAVRDAWHKNLLDVTSTRQLRSLFHQTSASLRALPVRFPAAPLRVGVIGEFFTIMDPFSNHDLERQLASYGIYIDRWLNLYRNFFHYKEKKMLPAISAYAKYSMGATAMGTIDAALRFAREGYDGIIHVKSFGCTPEMDAMPVLQNISADYKIPILYLSYDSQTSDTGLQTRLEAFYDMIQMRKDSIHEKSVSRH